MWQGEWGASQRDPGPAPRAPGSPARRPGPGHTPQLPSARGRRLPGRAGQAPPWSPAAETPIEEFTPTPAFPALQYLESVDVEGVAWRAGLRTGDFLIEVRPLLPGGGHPWAPGGHARTAPTHPPVCPRSTG